jgi:acetyl-CoA carboxylase biotin carboxyl carrier protein
MKIDAKAIRQLADLLDETGLTEIEVAEGEQMIRVNKGGVAMGGPVHYAAPANISMPSDPTVPQAANNAPPAAITSDHPGAVSSPMVGTAYMAAEPGATPFVKKGASVK